MKSTNAQNNGEIDKAKKLFAKGAYQEAVALLRKRIDALPNADDTYRTLGSMLAYSPAQEEALSMFQKALQLAPNNADNWIALAFFHKKNHLLKESIKAFREALHHQNDNLEALRQLFWISSDIKDNHTVLESAPKLLALDKENLLSISETYASVLLEEGKRKEALDIYESIVYTYGQKVSLFTLQSWYELMLKNNRMEEARKFIDSLYRQAPNNAKNKLFHAITLLDSGVYDEAISLFKESAKTASDNFEIQALLGKKFEEAGYRDEAIQCYRQAFILDNSSISTLYSIGRIHKYTYGDMYFTQLNKKMASIYEMSIEEQTTLHYALGKAYEDVDNLNIAFEHYRRAGSLRSHSGLKTKQSLIQFKTSKTTVTERLSKSNFQKLQQLHRGYRNNKPVFIVGMPRSGTTLMEQILSSFEGVHGAGELNYIDTVIKKFNLHNTEDGFYEKGGKTYIDMINTIAPKESKRVIDKMPENFRNLGQILLMLPDAYIIHARRHPVEICLSAYRIQFAHGHYWADDLRSMGRYYRLYHDMMAHWKKVLPEGKILEVRYEDMVNNLEKESKKLAAHIEVPWSEECLSFHRQKKVVRTASVAQVRQPIYKTSTNRWQKYAPYLSPLLDEIKDLVAAYEKVI